VQEQGKTYIGVDHDRKWLTDALDESSIHFSIWHVNEVTAYFRVHREVPTSIALDLNLASDIRSMVKIGYMSRLMIAPHKRARSSLAVDILCAAYEYLACDECSVVVTHATQRLIPLWKKFGNRPFGSSFMTETAGMQQPLALIIGDVEHLSSCGSPLRNCAQPEGRELRISAIKDLLWPMSQSDNDAPDHASNRGHQEIYISTDKAQFAQAA
jgi:hypothetical protein